MQCGFSLLLQSGDGAHLADIEQIAIDIVIPSIRLDIKGLLEMLYMKVPSGVDLCYYIISDNQNLQSEEFEYNGSPVRIIVNAENLGAPLSRNVGLGCRNRAVRPVHRR